MRVPFRSMRLRRSPGLQSSPRVAIAAVALVAAGALLGAACGGDDDGGSGGGGETVTATDGRVTVDAEDVAYDVDTIETAPGALDVTMIQRGSLDHTFVVEDDEGNQVGERLQVTTSTEEASGAYELEPGDYDFFCDVPGHRGQGMEGTIVVE